MSDETAVPVPVSGKNYQLAGPHVHVESLDPDLDKVIDKLAFVHSLLFGRPLVITSGNDGNHHIGSAHYFNKAVDISARGTSQHRLAAFMTLLVHGADEFELSIAYQLTNTGERRIHVEIF